MLIEGDELFDSLTDCDNLSDDWERTSCYGGVFMENIMARHNPDHATKYLKDDDPLYPCTAVEEKYAVSCYQMQTSQALTVLGQDFQKVFQLCAGIDPAYRATCYQSLGRDASGQSISNAETTKKTCMLGQSDEARLNCVLGAVRDFVSYFHSDQQATGFCDSLEPGLASSCNQAKKEYYATFKT